MESKTRSSTSKKLDTCTSRPKEDEAPTPEEELECAVCLQTCVHPVCLPCSHIFCFLCVKGVANQSKRCAMCRQEIPADFLDNPNLLKKIEEKESCTEGYQWFYEGRNGWWQYDERTSTDLEAAYNRNQRTFEILVAGFLYTVDFDRMVQQRRNDPSRRRRIKRDLATIPKKGVAGLKLFDDEENSSGELSPSAPPIELTDAHVIDDDIDRSYSDETLPHTNVSSTLGLSLSPSSTLSRSSSLPSSSIRPDIQGTSTELDNLHLLHQAAYRDINNQSSVTRRPIQDVSTSSTGNGGIGNVSGFPVAQLSTFDSVRRILDQNTFRPGGSRNASSTGRMSSLSGRTCTSSNRTVNSNGRTSTRGAGISSGRTDTSDRPSISVGCTYTGTTRPGTSTAETESGESVDDLTNQIRNLIFDESNEFYSLDGTEEYNLPTNNEDL